MPPKLKKKMPVKPSVDNSKAIDREYDIRKAAVKASYDMQIGGQRAFIPEYNGSKKDFISMGHRDAVVQDARDKVLQLQREKTKTLRKENTKRIGTKLSDAVKGTGAKVQIEDE